jgi:hypothetical protein
VVAVAGIETRARGGVETVAASAVRANAVVFADTARLRPVAQEDTEGRPAAIASGAGALWVSDAANNRVLRIDPRTHRTEDRIPVGRNPGGIVATPHGVWVVNTGSRTVSEIDPGSGTVVARVAAGNAPAAIAYGSASIRVADASDGTVTRIDPATATRLATIHVGQPLNDVAAGLGGVWASSAASGLLIRIDPRSNQPVQALTVGNSPTSIAIAGGAVWVANPPDGTLSRIDPALGVVRKVNVSHPGALTSAGGTLWVARTDRLDVVRVEPHTSAIVQAIPIGAPAASLTTYDGGLAVATLGTSAAHLGGTHQRARVDAGRADVMLDTPPGDSLADLARADPLQLHSYAQPQLYAMFLNTRQAPFDRPAVRRALALAADRTAIVRIMGGPRLARATCQIMPPSFPGYHPFCLFTRRRNPAGVWRVPDLGQARKLIKASKTAGMAISVSTIADDPQKQAIGRYFVGLLRRLGYRASLRLYAHDHGYYETVGLASARTQMGVFGWAADYQAASSFFQPLFTCAAYRPAGPMNLNPGGLCDPEVDQEIARATRLQATNTAAANAAWQRVDRQITVRAVWIPLVNSLGVDFVGARVGNYQRHTTFGVLLDQLWVR